MAGDRQAEPDADRELGDPTCPRCRKALGGHCRTHPKRAKRRRPKRYTETWEYLAFVERAIRNAGPRVGASDMDELHELVRLRNVLDAAIDTAVEGVQENGGYSWTAIGEAVGMSKQSAWERYSPKSPKRKGTR